MFKIYVTFNVLLSLLFIIMVILFYTAPDSSTSCDVRVFLRFFEVFRNFFTMFFAHKIFRFYLTDQKSQVTELIFQLLMFQCKFSWVFLWRLPMSEWVRKFWINYQRQKSAKKNQRTFFKFSNILQEEKYFTWQAPL